jgi:cytochrome c553
MKCSRPVWSLPLAALVGAVTIMARSALTVEVDPASLQGRTEAAIQEFRAAIDLTPDLAHGRELFESCAECHALDGAGSADGMIPVIAGQHVSVLVKQLVDFRHGRRWDARMQSASKQHALKDSQDLLDVAAYAQSLKRPPPRALNSTDAATVQEGRRIYYRDCERCHGRLAEGDLRAIIPRLAGQNYPYLRDQFINVAYRQRLGMDETHIERIAALSEKELAGVAAYLSQLRPEFTSTNPGE